MSAAANQTNVQLIKGLFKQLQSYGLNPREWRVVRQSLDASLQKFEVRHRQENDFRFQGSVCRNHEGHMHLARLKLLSI